MVKRKMGVDCNNTDMSLNDQEQIQHWNTCKKQDIFNPNDRGNCRNDLPQRYSLLLDSHFPLFVTLDTVSIIWHS